MRGLAHKHVAKRVTASPAAPADFCELANRARETTERERQRGRGGRGGEEKTEQRERARARVRWREKIRVRRESRQGREGRAE